MVLQEDKNYTLKITYITIHLQARHNKSISDTCII